MRFWVSEVNPIVWMATKEMYEDHNARIWSEYEETSTIYKTDFSFEEEYPLLLEDLPSWAMIIVLSHI